MSADEAGWAARVRGRLGPEADADVVLELAQHAASSYAAARAEGASVEQAQRAVEAELAGWGGAQAGLGRRPRRPPLLEPAATGTSGLAGVLHDLRHAARSLRRQPGHSALVVLTMAVGIGATTLLFSVVHGVLLRPLPWPRAERLVRLAETREGATRQWPWMFTNASYLPWVEDPATIEALAGWRKDTVTLTGRGDPERLSLADVTPSLFPMLSVTPELGEAFSEAQVTDGVLLLSHALWQQRFAGRPDAIGQVVELDGRPHRVQGVMPREFEFPDADARAWRPLQVPAVVGADGTSRGISLFSAMALLRPGVRPEQAAEEATQLARLGPDPGMVALALFGTKGAVRIRAVPAKDALVAEVRPALLLLLASVGLLLAAATANVASLQLARATARRRELAVRAALGAGGARLARLLLAESLLLGLAGGGLGLALAAVGHGSLPTLLPPDFPRPDAIALDALVAGVAVALSLGAGVAFGVLPALFARGIPLTEALADDGGGAIGAGRSSAARIRAAMLTGQVAVAALLLLGALQVGRSFLAMLGTERGFEPANLLVARLPMSGALFSPARRREIPERLVERLRALPAVRHAAFTSIVPLAPNEAVAAFTVPEGTRGAADGRLHTAVRLVSPDYFPALGRRLLAGRWFSEADAAGSPDVLVVNRTFARRHLGDDPVGSVLPIRLEEGHERWQVIGVVEDVKQARLTEPPQPELFASYRQRPSAALTEPVLVVRTGGAPEALAPTLRALVAEQDPALALGSIRSMQDMVETSLARPRLYSLLLGLFAACALAIAGVGLFGVLSYAVALRTREIGLRVALGARPRDVVRLVAGRGLRLACAGLALGLLAAAFLGRFVASLLYGVRPQDPLGVAAVALALVGVAGLASALPALRAARIDPQRALREG
ncbi:MAG: ADOP family duplicated permease [Vicinamibacteria bacterium]